MKVAVQCQSPLLQKSLELFLERHLCSINKCDIVIRDEACLNDERCFFIGSSESADLKKPFSKSQLILALEKRYPTMLEESENSSVVASQAMDFAILEQRIAALTQEYQANILRTVKAFYEK